MKIILAASAGFCFGVKRAVDCVYKEAKRDKIYTYGSIIHNKEVTEELGEKGVQVIHDLEGIKEGTVILRSHGTVPLVYEQLEKNKIKYIDCICPDVKKIHKIISSEIEKGSAIIIIGNPQHPEVIAQNGYAYENAIIISKPEEVEHHTFDLSRRYSVVIQTTFQKNKSNEIINVLRTKGINMDVHNTICRATELRQTEASQIAQKVDIMLVIGDKNSNNTNELYQICKNKCKNTIFIETIRDLELNIFSSNDKIGITAGASTSPATIKEAIRLMSDLDNGNNQANNQTFEEMLNETFVTLHTGDIVKGTVIAVSNGEVSVNLGFKSDGLIQRGEFSDDPDTTPEKEVKPGDEIEVFVIRVNDGEGNVLLSKKRVDSQKGIAEIEESAGTDKVFKGKVVEIVKGGLIAIINGIRAFVPSSQVSDRYVENMTVFKGRELDFNILEVDKSKHRVIAGRKDLVKKTAAENKEKALNTLQPGKKAEGTVSRIVDFGAFVDLGGIDGLIHISELSWGRVKKASDILKEGDKVVVTVLEINKEKEKISLSLRDAQANPWIDAEEKYAVGNVVEGKVVRIVPFGAFVELEEGIDGLVHISQISLKRIEKPEDVLSIGQIIEVKVTDIKPETKKISLSIKALEATEDESQAEKIDEAAGQPEVTEELIDVAKPESDDVVQ